MEGMRVKYPHAFFLSRCLFSSGILAVPSFLFHFEVAALSGFPFPAQTAQVDFEVF